MKNRVIKQFLALTLSLTMALGQYGTVLATEGASFPDEEISEESKSGSDEEADESSSEESSVEEVSSEEALEESSEETEVPSEEPTEEADTEAVADEASLEESAVIAEETPEEEDLPKGLVGMPEGYTLSSKEIEFKQDLLAHDTLEAFDGGTAQGASLKIGSNSYIEGFESGLVGVEKGQTVDLNLTFPEDYGAENLAGKAVVFTVTVNSINTEAEDITDDWAAGLGLDGVTNLEELKKYALDTLNSNAKDEYDTTVG